MNSENQNKELINLMVKKLSGEGTPAEEKKLQEALDSSLVHQKLFREMQETWQATQQVKGLTHDEVEIAWQRLEGEIESSQVAPWTQWLRIAASVILIVSVAATIFLMLQSNENVLQAQTIITKEFEDGTTVTMKPGSMLTYPKEFQSNSREVFVEGEVFFEVTKDAERPFIVETKDIQVQVVGTKFNVRSDEKTEVVVVSGIVDVKYNQQTERLHAGDLARLNKETRQLTGLKTDNPNLLAWKTRDFTFDNVSLEQVVIDLNRAYQSSIRLEGNIAECPISASFTQESLESVLKVIQAALDLSIKGTGQEIILSGAGC